MEPYRMRDQIRTVAERWRQQYEHPQSIHWSRDRKAIYSKLLALDGETATQADVAAIIGNPAWIKPHRCCECGLEVWDIILMGDPQFEGEAPFMVCLACIILADTLLQGEA